MQDSWVDHPNTLELLQSLVYHPLVPWGRLTQIKAPMEVIARLKATPAVALPDYTTPRTLTVHSQDLGIGALKRISTEVLAHVCQQGLLSASTPVDLRFRQGNLFALIKPTDLPKEALYSTDVYFGVDLDQNCLAWYHIGKMHAHHALYDYAHLDHRRTTLEKLLLSKRLSSVYVGLEDDYGFCDLPF